MSGTGSSNIVETTSEEHQTHIAVDGPSDGKLERAAYPLRQGLMLRPIILALLSPHRGGASAAKAPSGGGRARHPNEAAKPVPSTLLG